MALTTVLHSLLLLLITVFMVGPGADAFIPFSPTKRTRIPIPIVEQPHQRHHQTISSFSGNNKPSFASFSKLQSKENDDNDDDLEKVEVGSKEYLEGFLSSPLQDETVAERGSGLEQAIKLGGGVTLVLIFLLVGFLASNGLL